MINQQRKSTEGTQQHQSSAILLFVCYFTFSASTIGALTLLLGRQEGHPACEKKTEWWNSRMVTCLGRGADLYMAQLMPLPLTISCSSKSRLVLPSWLYLSSTSSPG